MKLSKLIKELERLKIKHGDLEVVESDNVSYSPPNCVDSAYISIN